MTSRYRPILLAMATLAGAMFTPGGHVTGASPIVPLRGEIVLTEVERQQAVDTMRPKELAALRWAFDAHAKDVLVLSYTRKLLRIVTETDGRQVPLEIAPSSEASSAVTRVSSEAAGGSAMKEDLYVSMTVTRTRGTKPYEWRIWAYAEWRDGLRGMTPPNESADSMAVAWAGGAYLHSQTARGERYSHWPCSEEELDEWPSDGSPNIGTAWSFHEFGGWGCPMHWALVEVHIRQDRLIGRSDNLVYKYFHTYSGLDYDFTFSKSPGITISPTREQWSLALFATYTH